jgi:antitoxin PrlF
LKPGDRVKFFLDPDGTLVLLPKLPVIALRGSRRRVSLGEMDKAIAGGAVGPSKRR